MKKLLAILTLAAAVAAAPVAAQTYSGDAAGEPAAPSSTSTTESATEMTLNGTVVSSNATELVLATSQGQKTFQLSDLSTPPADLSVGSRVTVHYRDVEGQMVATHLVVGEGTQDTGAWAAAPPAPADEDAMAGAQSPTNAGTYQDPATAAELEAEAQDDEFLAGRDADLDADADLRVTTGADPAQAEAGVSARADVAQDGEQDGDDDALPATASDVPLMALIGALALVAAVVLRRIH